MPSEKKDRAIFRIDGESVLDVDDSHVHEDDYSEEAMGPGKKRAHRPSPREDAAQWKKRQKKENKNGSD